MIFILYNPFNRHYKKPILSLLLSRFTKHFVSVIGIMSHFLSLHLSLQHKKGGVHNRSNQLESRHYRISRLDTT